MSNGFCFRRSNTLHRQEWFALLYPCTNGLMLKPPNVKKMGKQRLMKRVTPFTGCGREELAVFSLSSVHSIRPASYFFADQ